MSVDTIAVVGAGVSGLIQARHLAERGRRVLIVEQQRATGGLLRSGRAPWGPVDQGPYIFQESGMAALDHVLFGVLPEEEWHVLEGPRKDVAGNYFAGRVNEGALYPDLRALPEPEYERTRDEVIARAAFPPPEFGDAGTLADYLERRFGPHTAGMVFRPIAEKFWRQPPENLSPWAAKILHLTRVVVDGPSESLALKSASPGLDARIGYPDQMSIPRAFLRDDRAYYPRRYGTSTVVDALEAALAKQDVTLMTGAEIKRLGIQDGRITEIEVQRGDTTEDIRVSDVLWTTPAGFLMPLLGLEGGQPPPDRPVPHRVVWLLLDRPPETGSLYWLWCYDQRSSWIRFSSPAAFCPSAAEGGAHPVCVEMHVADPGISDQDAVAQADRELRRDGIFSGATAVLDSYVLPGGRGYFAPTIGNTTALEVHRAAVLAHAPSNLHLSNQDLSAGIFYLNDILRASAPVLERL